MPMQTARHKVACIIRWPLLLLFFFLCCKIALLYHGTFLVQHQNRQLADLKAIPSFNTQNPFHALSEINPDFAGWLTVDGTTDDIPVDLCKDNQWYLEHDFYGQPNRHGTLFLDSATNPNANGNLIVYGHNMKDNTMFGELDHFKDKKFFTQNGLVLWETEQDKTYYQIFAGLVLPGSSFSQNYLDLTRWANVLSDSDSEKMLQQLHSRASLWRNVQHRSGDKYLFLVTCDYTKTNGRWVLVAQSLSEEDTQRIQDAA